MTREEYIQKIEELKQQELEIKVKKGELYEEYKESLNEPYKHLLNKKVTVTYNSWFWNDKSDEKKTVTGYWGGYYLEFGDFKPRFYQVKKDGSMSSRELHIYPREIISMEEVKSE
jgi:hypothetical protein